MNNHGSQDFNLVRSIYEFGAFQAVLNFSTDIVSISGVDGAGGEIRVAFGDAEQMYDMLAQINSTIRDEYRRRDWWNEYNAQKGKEAQEVGNNG